MTSTEPSSRNRRAAVDFAEARIAAQLDHVVAQRAAARRVAERSLDVGDCRELLAMLGLSNQGARE